MRDILVCYADSTDEDNEPNVLVFSTKVQTMMGVSANRKIQALCYLFDNLLATNAQLATALKTNMASEEFGEDSLVTKEDAYTALQMAITAMAANYQNGDGE